jgi:hypothetical protein
MTFTTATFYLAGMSESRLVSFCFGGKNGQKAVQINPTGIATNFDGAITGDLALTKLQEGWDPWAKFHEEFINGAKAGETGRDGTLTLKKYSKKGALQETLVYQLGKIAPVGLAAGNAEASGKTEILTVCFEEIKLKYFPEAPAPKPTK